MLTTNEQRLLVWMLKKAKRNLKGSKGYPRKRSPPPTAMKFAITVLLESKLYSKDTIYSVLKRLEKAGLIKSERGYNDIKYPKEWSKRRMKKFFEGERHFKIGDREVNYYVDPKTLFVWLTDDGLSIAKILAGVQDVFGD